MAGPAVVMPAQNLGQHFSGNPAGGGTSNYQAPSRFSQPPPHVSSQSTDHHPRHNFSHGPSQSFHRPYQFRPRFPPNKGGQDDAASGLMYDGKRMRKAIHRKTVDYNPSVLKYLQSRIWQRDSRDQHRIQPDSLYSVDLVPPPALMENPMNAVTTRFVRTSTNKFRCPIFCLTWTPEGRRLVTGASSGEFTLWNGLTFNFETILQAHETAVRAMRWSHSDSWMVTADHAGYVKYWQSNMNNVKMYQAHKEPIRGIRWEGDKTVKEEFVVFFLTSFCPSDSKFASCSDDGTVRVWDFMRCHEERILRGHGADVRCVDWHPQKALLASGSKDNQQPVKLWDPRTGNSLATLHAHKHTVMDLKWHKNGNWMLTASRDHLLKLFDIRNLKEELQTFKGHKREATAIGWHPIHEGLFVSGSADGALMFWMVGCDHEVGGMEEAHEGMVWSVAWHPLGHILASGSNDHATKFWTRNRPGDEMRDKYNLNTLPVGMMEQEMLEYSNQESAMPNLPGMGLEHGLPEHLQVKEEPKDENELPSIPGLDWEEDSIYLKAEERASHKKVPYARPVPKMFEQAWTGEIDMEEIKKEQQQKQQQQQQQQQQQAKAQFMPPSQSSLLLAQQMLGAAIAGTIRQQLAASEGGRMLLPGGPLMLGPGGPRMIIAPGQPVMGGPGGQMMLIPGGPGPGSRPLGPAMMQQQNNSNMGPQQQGGQQGPTTTGSNNTDNKSNTINSAGTQNGTAVSQQGAMSTQTGPNQTQQNHMGPNQGQGGPGPGQVRPQGPHAQMGGPQMRPQGQLGGPQSQMSGPQGQMGLQGQMGGPQGQMGAPQGQMGPQGQMSGPQGQMGGPQGQMGPQRPRGPQGQAGGPEGQMSGPQGQIRGPRGQMRPQGGLLGLAPSQGQNMGPRMPGPQFQGPAAPQGQFNRGAPSETDMDERMQGQKHGQMSSQRDTDMDQDFRPRVYNGPAGPLNMEDQDFRQQGPPPGQMGARQGNTGDSRGRGRGNLRGGLRGGHSGAYEEEGSYEDYGDMDERMMDTGDYDHRVASGRGRGRGNFSGRDSGRGGSSGWEEYDNSGEYAEEGWEGEEEGVYEEGYDEGYGEEYSYEDQDERGGDNRGRKRAWEEGPGKPTPRGRGGRGGWTQGEGRGRGRGSGFRGNRGRASGGGFRGGRRGWGRGAGGERGGWGRGSRPPRGGYQ